jgi:hypothetical protein
MPQTLMRTQHAAFTALNVAANAPLPKEFRLFKFGENPTSKGTFTLTRESAAACMAEYQKEGVRLMVDLNHDSLNENALALRSDASDARGWFSLELRADGLWAANVDWTPDGARRLRERTQPYISPVFKHTQDGIVMAIANVAMCAMPATYNAQALVAASRYGAKNSKSLSARVTLEQLTRVELTAQGRGITIAELVRQGVLTLVAQVMSNGPPRPGATLPKDPGSVLSDIAVALDLPETAPIADVLAGIQSLADLLQGPSADGSAPGLHLKDPPPGTSSFGSLTATELFLCAKNGISHVEYLRGKASGARSQQRTPAAPPPAPAAQLSRQTLATLKARGMSVAEFEQLKRDAVRRV